MALLSRSIVRSRSVAAALLLGGLTVAGCVLVKAFYGPGDAFAFSHRIHVEGEGMDCDACHRNWETSDQPGLPGPKVCALCHEEQDAQKPAGRRAADLFDGQEFRAAHATQLPGDVIFSHQAHATRGIECSACHEGVERDQRVGAHLGLRMDDCVSCHQERSGPQECAACHTSIRADLPPPSHGALWRRGHGALVRECTGQTAARCDLCHKQSDCDGCHQAEQPQSHNNFWRRRGHGLSASMDRESCSTCHQSDSCNRCHAETQPLSHTGSWGAPLDRHCLSCHEPLRDNSCFACHTASPSHALAPPKPSSHLPTMNCRQCHGAGQPLPHVDNGMDCNFCHR